MDAVLWALSYSMLPHRDAEIIRGKVPRLDLSVSPSSGVRQLAYPDGMGSSGMLINARREHPYLPVSLPRRDLMEAAKARWEGLGLPALDLRTPVVRLSAHRVDAGERRRSRSRRGRALSRNRGEAPRAPGRIDHR